MGETDVTLIPLHELDARQSETARTLAGLRGQAQALGSQAGDRLEEAGRLLLQRRDEWKSEVVDAAVLDEAEGLRSAVEAEGTTVSDLRVRPHHGLGGLVSRVRDSMEAGRAEAAMSQAAARLRPLLMQIAQAAPDGTLQEVDLLRGEARDLQRQAASVTEAAGQQAQLMRNRDEEIAQRKEASQHLGFDALYAAAQLTANGPTAIETPLILKRDEHAYFSTPARLARQKTRTRIVGGSQGFSFPIGHTGIRYRVGSFHGEPVRQEYLATVDQGTLVLTNQRIAFVGALKSVAYPLEKVMHIESYKDGLAVFKEGRENADTYLCGTPQQFLMNLNFVLEHR